jgi:hypothetical protein
MTDTPAPTFTPPEGLPTPWNVTWNAEYGLHEIAAYNGAIVAFAPTRERAEFLPAMLAEIERLQAENHELNTACDAQLRENNRLLARLNDFTDPKTPGMVSVGLLNTEREVSDSLRAVIDRLLTSGKPAPMTDTPSPCRCPSCGCVHEPGCTPLAVSSLPDECVDAATKLLCERIPLILDFGDKAVSFYLMAGVEDLARDVLALAAPVSSPPEEIEDHLKFLRTYSTHPGITDAAAALQRLAQEVERLNRERNEALQLTECCHTLKDMAAACIEGAMWKDRAEKAEARIAELERVFDTQWECSQRAIKMWQATNPGNDMVWPDKAKLLVWLMSRITELEAKLNALTEPTKS